MRGGVLVEGGAPRIRSTPTDFGGDRYHSKKEADYAAQLALMMRARGKDRVLKWERQVKIPLAVARPGSPEDAPFTKICDYIIDFVVHYADGRVEYVEVKGFKQEVWKLKWKLFEALYPDLTKVIV